MLSCLIHIYLIMCLRPRAMYETGRTNPETGKAVYRFTPSPFAREDSPSFFVPCGKCVECLEAKRLEWCKRMRLELSTAGKASFITLTFRDPPPAFVDKRDLQRFFKRLRHMERDIGIPFPKNFKYFAVGEYGKKLGRPHYHAIVYGLDFMDSVFKPRLACYSAGYPVWTSSVLEKYWPYGFVSVDKVTPRSIRYVSKYVSKSATPSVWAMPGYEEFYLHSIGLGRDLFVDCRRQGRRVVITPKTMMRNVYGTVASINDFIVMDADKGIKERPPRFLDRYLEKIDSGLFEAVKLHRKEFLRTKPPELAPPLVRAEARYQKLSDEEKKRKLDNES